VSAAQPAPSSPTSVLSSAALPVDITGTPFSIRGSFFAVSAFDDDLTPGVYLRTVRGGVRNREILRLRVGDELLPSVEVSAGRLMLREGDAERPGRLAARAARAASPTPASGVLAEVELTFSGRGRTLIRVLSGTLTIDFAVRDRYDVVLAESERAWRFVDSGAVRNYRLELLAGAARFSSGWDVEHSTDGRLEISAADGPALLAIDEFGSAPAASASVSPGVANAGGHSALLSFDDAVASAEADFDRWWKRHGAPAAHDPRFEPTARLAAYVTWSALVPAGGALRRESMLMSKNRMAHIWSWDHCFNAMALRRDPTAALDQLLTIFDHQDEHGGLPDHIDDAGVQFNFAKPPIHGWTVTWLMDHDAVSDGQLAALEAPLRRWTTWWREQRDYRGDGIPSYNHGNDSGWDNSTVFGEGVPVQSPDLLAFLALQESALGRIAERLGRPDDAALWRGRAASTVAQLVDGFWTGERFAARHTLSGERIPSRSLLTLMPLALGELLPPEVFAAAVAALVEGGYLTAVGPATEPPSSPDYDPDGYWRGPVWAPTTLLLVDGLRRGGRADLAERIARDFAAACAAEGMAENFDALSGAGLRDRSMTWTASVLLVLLDTLGAPEGVRADAADAAAASTGARA
jgi:putative isomerase